MYQHPLDFLLRLGDILDRLKFFEPTEYSLPLKKWWLEDYYFPFGKVTFQEGTVKLQVVCPWKDGWNFKDLFVCLDRILWISTKHQSEMTWVDVINRPSILLDRSGFLGEDDRFLLGPSA